jgi:hypothetical protein
MRDNPGEDEKALINVNISLPENFRGNISLPDKKKELPNISDAEEISE